MSVWERWVDACKATEDGVTLAQFRIALAGIVLVDTCMALQARVVEPLYQPVVDGGMAPANRMGSLLLWSLPHTTMGTWALFASIVGLSAAVMVGFGGRLTTFLLLQAVLWQHALPIDIGGGYDRLLTNGLWLLVLGGASATWSVDNRLRNGAFAAPARVSVVPRALGLFQLVVLYTSTGIAKGGAAWWYPYEAVYLALQRQSWSRWGELWWLGDLYPLTQVATVAAWWWEATFLVLGVWFIARAGWLGQAIRGAALRFDLRWPYLGAGVVMHVVLGAVMNLGTFSSVCLAYYLLALRLPRSGLPVEAAQVSADCNDEGTEAG